MSTVKHQQGVSLIEVMVAMIIFSVGILGMTTLQTRVLQQNFDQQQRDTAIWSAQAIIDRVSLNKSSAAMTAYGTAINSATLCNTAPTKMCAQTKTTSAAICSTSEMATFDAWDVLCNSGNGDGNLLNDFSISFKCKQQGCVLGNLIEIEFLWRSRISTSDARLPTSVIGSDTTLANSGADIEGYAQVFSP
jgi:type IV pilus modification protein PilV